MKTLRTMVMLIIMALLAACGGGPTIGTPPPVHFVDLTWTESVTGTLTYTVYRGTTPGGPYLKLATTTDKTYHDGSVVEGVYYYVVDAQIGGQAYRSNELKATP